MTEQKTDETEKASKLAKKGLDKVVEKARRLEQLEVEYVDTSSIRPNPWNPNVMAEREFEILKQSIRDNGFTVPVIVQRSTRQIVDGEHRWRAAREVGLAQIPVVFVDMTEEQMRVATLVHNRATGSHDTELEASLLRDFRELGALDLVQRGMGLSDADVERLLSDTPAAELLAGEQFGEAWAPVRNLENSESAGDQGNVPLVASSTDAARELNARLMKKMQNASSEGERQEIERQRRAAAYRVQLLFSNDDARMVRGVLGDKPAQALLNLCVAERAVRDSRKEQAGA